jgi:hypothetical protein
MSVDDIRLEAKVLIDEERRRTGRGRSVTGCGAAPSRDLLPAGGTVDKFPHDVGVSGVPDGLARHVSEHLAKRTRRVTDRLRGQDVRASGCVDVGVALGNCSPIAGVDLIWRPV